MISAIFGAGLESIAESVNLTVDELITKFEFIKLFIDELKSNIIPNILILPQYSNVTGKHDGSKLSKVLQNCERIILEALIKEAGK